VEAVPPEEAASAELRIDTVNVSTGAPTGTSISFAKAIHSIVALVRQEPDYEPLSIERICRHTCIDLSSKSKATLAVLENIRKHVSDVAVLDVEPVQLVRVPPHGVACRRQLHQLFGAATLPSAPTDASGVLGARVAPAPPSRGVLRSELTRAYAGVEADIDFLIAQGAIHREVFKCLVQSVLCTHEVLYPRTVLAGSLPARASALRSELWTMARNATRPAERAALQAAPPVSVVSQARWQAMNQSRQAVTQQLLRS
jgi:hypothetical protein